MVIDLEKLVEQERDVFSGDAAAGVGDMDPDVLIRRVDRQLHASVVRVLDGVVHQIAEDALELGAVAGA